MTDQIGFDRRFSGVKRLYGEQGLAQLYTAHVVVIGVGGVGSWVVEALARHAVGKITLVDLDNIAESNVNRQLHAVDGAFGQAKVSAMHARILSINPNCVVQEIEDFITPDNISGILGFNCDVIIDCTDDAKAKVALASYCKSKQLPLIMSGSAGGRLDPTCIQIADLAAVTGDKLLSKVRNQLRRNHGFPKASSSKNLTKFGVQCVYSNEAVIKPGATGGVGDNASITGLNCAGYGSSVCITASFGFAAAQLAINQLVS